MVMDMQERVVEVLDGYFAENLGKVELPDFEELERYRQRFLAKFGPERLAQMSKEALLVEVPFNLSSRDSMDRWLDNKNDEEFRSNWFGGISGGWSTSYVVWQVKSGDWKSVEAGKTVTTSEEQAIEILVKRRRELLAAVNAVAGFGGASADEINPEDFQKAINEAAPNWGNRAWFHKYLHLVFPNLVTWTATKDWSEADTYYLGIVPHQAGIYAQGIQAIRFWNRLSSLQTLPVELRYRVPRGFQPRTHRLVRLPGEIRDWENMVLDRRLKFGPAEIEDLTAASEYTKKSDIENVVKAAFKGCGRKENRAEINSLVELFFRLQDGDLFALLSDANTVMAVGRIDGGYEYINGDTLPHQLPVTWIYQEDFQLREPANIKVGLHRLTPNNSAVADIGASLLLHGEGPWPDFKSFVALSERASDLVPMKNKAEKKLPVLEGIQGQVFSILKRKGQVILYGPPGTGKTYHAERIALEIVARHNFGGVSSELTKTKLDRVYGRGGQDPYVELCTFHPMYSYEDFIEGYRPDGQGFGLESGVFKRMADAAGKEPEKQFVLIIDEINRGNIAKIFGELITLIEVGKRGRTHVRLPLSKESFTVPKNLMIIGTMNTADRSILLLDTALRRRFGFKELMPEPALLGTRVVRGVSVSAWLRALNRRIVAALGRDGRNLQIGHSYLMEGGKAVATLERFGEVVRDEIWPLIQEYCYEDAQKIEAILGCAPDGLYDSKAVNLKFELFEPGEEDALERALLSIVEPEDREHGVEEVDDVDDQADEDNDEGNVEEGGVEREVEIV